MSRKHYKAVVEVLNRFTGDGNGPSSLFEHEKFNALVEDFANMFQQDNPRFDRARFFEAVSRYGE